MANSIQAIRGMNDILPSETHLWQFVENKIQQVLQSYGFDEIRLPIVEKTELFKRSVGEATDIVEKEMYTFLDRNEDSLSLRPEGTAGCVRAGIEHGLLYNQIQRLWYQGPYFRHERPQKGRYRQFHQTGVEIFGIATPDIDAELIILSARIFKELGLTNYVSLQINSLGTTEARENYRKALVEYLTQHLDKLDEDSKRRLQTNPLRILDSKNPDMQSIVSNAPKLTEYLDEESRLHFSQLKAFLKQMQIPYEENPCLVRGLDYYTKTVFEWVTNDLGAQGTVCAGGRYDGLVEQLGGKATPALGFAIGMERLILLVQHANAAEIKKSVDIYLMTDSDAAYTKALELSQHLRAKFPTLIVLQHSGGGAIKNQFKRADKSGAQLAMIIGQQELDSGVVGVKFLREEKPQQEIAWNNLEKFVSELF